MGKLEFRKDGWWYEVNGIWWGPYEFKTLALLNMFKSEATASRPNYKKEDTYGHIRHP